MQGFLGKLEIIFGIPTRWILTIACTKSASLRIQLSDWLFLRSAAWLVFKSRPGLMITSTSVSDDAGHFAGDDERQLVFIKLSDAVSH